MEDYYQDKKQKRDDFWRGFILNVAVGVGTAGLSTFLLIISDLFVDLLTPKTRTIIAIGFVVISVGILEFILIRKYFKNRRYMAIGLIVSLVLPLLVIGACSPMFFELSKT